MTKFLGFLSSLKLAVILLVLLLVGLSVGTIIESRVGVVEQTVAGETLGDERLPIRGAKGDDRGRSRGSRADVDGVVARCERVRAPVVDAERGAVGASLQAVKQKLPDLPAGSRILTVAYDTGERYLSIEGFLPA